MEFHKSKCQVISITNKVKPIIVKYQIHDHILKQVNCAKYLGIYIDSKLAFNAHVDAIVKKAISTRAFLARNIRRCSRNVKQMAYTTYIRPTVVNVVNDLFISLNKGNICVRGSPWNAANRLHGQRTGAFTWRPVLGLSRKTDQFRLDPTQNSAHGRWYDRV